MAESLLKGVTAVILDMDGLMIDSEPLHCKAYDRVLSQFGLGLTEDENNKRYVGISDKDIAADMVARYGLSPPAADLMRQKQETYLGLLREGVTPQPGLFELLSALRDLGLRAAIASSSMRHEIETVMDALHLRSFIDDYCSATEVERGKPAPALFLLAAAKLSAAPENCLVLEDAPAGVAAARASGMLCFAVPSRETASADFGQASMKFQSLLEVTAFIRRAF